MISRNIHYGHGEKLQKHMLDVFYDPSSTAKKPVVIFIHGGSWMSGSKDMYIRLGENLSAMGYTTVIINYRLYPSVNITGMISDCQEALNWTYHYIEKYNGNPNEIFIMGHSAGGHLSAVTTLNNTDKIKGLILVDAFGLSAYYFLTHHKPWIPEHLDDIFGNDPAVWEKCSPDKLLNDRIPPTYILTGGETYPFLLADNENFIQLLCQQGHQALQKVYPKKTHMQMIRMFESNNAEAYTDIDSFMKAQLSSL